MKTRTIRGILSLGSLLGVHCKVSNTKLQHNLSQKQADENYTTIGANQLKHGSFQNEASIDPSQSLKIYL
jgi:hypothetical protein